MYFEGSYCIFDSMIQQIHPNKIRQFLFVLILILLAAVITKELYFFLSAFLGAITLYVLMYSMMKKLVLIYHWKKAMAAVLLMLISLLTLVLPGIWVASILFTKITPLFSNPSFINSTVQTIHDYLVRVLNIDLLNEENMKQLNQAALPFLQKMIGGTMNGVANLFMMYFILYFLLTASNEVESWLIQNVPFRNYNVTKVIAEFRSMVYSNAVGIPIVAALQGLVGLIGYWIFGVEQFLIWGLLTAIFSMLPVVGSMILYIPLGIYELAIGHTWQGFGIILWGFFLIGTVDNIARFIIQKKIANVHPLITIFGVIIGINIFGFLGIIFGPLLISMFVLLVRIYIDEFGQSESETRSEPPQIHIR